MQHLPPDDASLPDTLVMRAVSGATRAPGGRPINSLELETSQHTRTTSSMRAQLMHAMRFHAGALTALLIAIVVGQYATLVQTAPVPVYADTVSYLLAAHAILAHGQVFSTFRTPGYPGFLAILQLLAGSDGPHHVVAAQAAVMVLAVLEIYALSFNITQRRWIAAIIGACCGLNLYFLDWERTTLTEACSLWVCVTVFLLLERYMRTGKLKWLASLCGTLFLAIMVRPTFVFLPLLLVALLALRAARRRIFTSAWRELAAALIVVYLLVVGYMAGNRIVNGYFGLSYVSNVNLLGKVMEYQLQDDNSNPQYARLQSDLDNYLARHAGSWDPWLFMDAYTQYGQPPYTAVGKYADQVIERHPLQYVVHTVPDMVISWQASPYVYAPWNVTPGWIKSLVGLSNMELGAYALLPVLLVTLALLAWRTRASTAAFMLFSMLVCVSANVYMGAAASYGEYYRLRAPYDWAMLVVALIALCWACQWALRGWGPGAEIEMLQEKQSPFGA